MLIAIDPFPPHEMGLPTTCLFVPSYAGLSIGFLRQFGPFYVGARKLIRENHWALARRGIFILYLRSNGYRVRGLRRENFHL